MARVVISVFFSYSHVDEALRDELEKQLAMLKRQGVIGAWHDRRISAGQELHSAISDKLETADLILLLVSPDFLASDYCYENEMFRAMERHDAGEATVVPVILRPCDWHGAPFGKLMATPPDGRPVTQWPDRDQAFLEVTKAIRSALREVSPIAGSPTLSTRGAVERFPERPAPTPIRSSNLRVTKVFTDRDKDLFRLEAFEYMAKFFENSLAELAARNADIEGTYRRVDANGFTAIAYRNGRAVARCAISTASGGFHSGIAYSASDTLTNSFNEKMWVNADDQSLFLRGLGMASFGRGRAGEDKLTMEGAAEAYWSMFVQPLQNS
jgi:hypothetical protein